MLTCFAWLTRHTTLTSYDKMAVMPLTPRKSRVFEAHEGAVIAGARDKVGWRALPKERPLFVSSLLLLYL